MMNTWTNVTTFLSEVRAEMKKVTFPSRQEVVATTIVVLVASGIFAVFLWLTDAVIQRAYEGIYTVLGS